jgi:hypothetical protein
MENVELYRMDNGQWFARVQDCKHYGTYESCCSWLVGLSHQLYITSREIHDVLATTFHVEQLRNHQGHEVPG